MTFFSVNHFEGEAKEFEPIAPGTYEAIVSDTEDRPTQSGQATVSLTLTIRDDVDQPFAKRKMFDRLFIGEKSMWRFQQYAKATNMPNGANFESEQDVIDAFVKHLKGKAVQIKITHQKDPYNEKYPEQVSVVSTSDLGSPAAAPNVFQQYGGGANAPFNDPSNRNQDPFSDNGKPLDISDDNLPF